jgi:hypothetical protein
MQLVVPLLLITHRPLPSGSRTQIPVLFAPHGPARPLAV